MRLPTPLSRATSRSISDAPRSASAHAAALVLAGLLSTTAPLLPASAAVFSCDATGKNCVMQYTDKGELTSEGAAAEDARVQALMAARQEKAELQRQRAEEKSRNQAEAKLRYKESQAELNQQLSDTSSLLPQHVYGARTTHISYLYILFQH